VTWCDELERIASNHFSRSKSDDFDRRSGGLRDRPDCIEDEDHWAHVAQDFLGSQRFRHNFASAEWHLSVRNS
jgi:hypothetical protein